MSGLAERYRSTTSVKDWVPAAVVPTVFYTAAQPVALRVGDLWVGGQY